MRSKTSVALLALAWTLAAAGGGSAAETLSLGSRHLTLEEARAGVCLPVEATTGAGPLDAFVLPVSFPSELELVDFSPAGIWLRGNPGRLEFTGPRDGVTSLAILAVVPDPEAPDLPLVLRDPGGQPQLIAELRLRFTGEAVPEGPLEVAFADGEIGFGGGPPLRASLVIGGEDYFSGGGDGRGLELRSAAVCVTEELEGATFRRGDANGDGRVNLTDGVFILNWLFRSGPAPSCLDASDADDSGGVNLTDAVRVLRWLFRGGPPPPFPGPAACGLDLTADDLTRCCQEACL